jgi:hypothetical protein
LLIDGCWLLIAGKLLMIDEAYYGLLVADSRMRIVD